MLRILRGLLSLDADCLPAGGVAEPGLYLRAHSHIEAARAIVLRIASNVDAGENGGRPGPS